MVVICTIDNAQYNITEIADPTVRPNTQLSHRSHRPSQIQIQIF